MSQSDVSSFGESRKSHVFGMRQAIAAHNPFARGDTSRPSSPVPSETGDIVELTRKTQRRPISRKHVEQALRLFGETLQEDLACDYAFDLHFSAVDYSLKALPENSFDDAPARKANIRRRLSKLLEQVGTDGIVAVEKDAKWWQQPKLPFGGQSAPPMTTPGADGSFELLGTCPSCASRVPVHVPAWLANGNAQPQNKRPATWEELAVGAVVGFAVMIKQSPLPFLLTSIVTTIWQGLIYLDDRFEVHQRFLLLLGAIIEGLVILDRELGVLRKCGDLLHKGWDIGISAMLAFAKAEGYTPAPRTGAGGPPLPATISSSPEFATQPILYTTAPTPKRAASLQGHTARNSWPRQEPMPAPVASTSSLRGLRSPASYDHLRSAATGDLAAPDSDDGVSMRTRSREDGWAGKLGGLVPGRR